MADSPRTGRLLAELRATVMLQTTRSTRAVSHPFGRAGTACRRPVPPKEKESSTGDYFRMRTASECGLWISYTAKE